MSVTINEAIPLARAALHQIEIQIVVLRNKCTGVLSDDEACLGVADEAAEFLAGPANRLFSKMLQGDVDAGRSLQQACDAIRPALEDEIERATNESGTLNTVRRFVSEVIVKSAVDVVEQVPRFAFGGGTLLLGIAAAYFVFFRNKGR